MRSPIRVVPTSNTMRLDPMSRIHFGRVYTVEKNVKVMDVGTVHPDHLLDLRNHFYHTFLPPSSQGPIAARAGQSDTGALSQVPRAETSQDYAAILRNAGPSGRPLLSQSGNSRNRSISQVPQTGNDSEDSDSDSDSDDDSEDDSDGVSDVDSASGRPINFHTS